MRKFLKLVQENTPGEEAGRGPYTVEYKDSQGNVMAKLTILNDVGSSYDNFLRFAEVTQGDLEVASEQPVEDQEDSEMLDREFKNEAETEPKYAEALKDRKRVLDNKLMDYKKQTQELKTS